LRWAWLLLLAAISCSPEPLAAQSTTNAPRPPDTKPLSVLVWPEDLLTLYEKIETLQNDSALLAEQVKTLQSQLEDSETIQQMLSGSLADSSTRLASLAQAAEARAALDQKAVDEARGQRVAWAAGGMLVGAASVALLAFLFHR
jgi:small-conductance mechanosensitive channel